MLDPQSRRLVSEVLRPPQGYSLSRAIGTTFSLDLSALITAPLSFALFDWEDLEGRPAADATAVMEALRRYADRITIFCQSGHIRVPEPQQALYAHLEASVVEAATPRGLFHPKTWLLRFEREGEPSLYRFLCLTRNLTQDWSWDTALILDGELKRRQKAIALNHPLGNFIQALPTFALQGVSEQLQKDIDRMQHEVRRVDWDYPPNVDEIRFHPLGLQRRTWPFSGRIDRMLVLAPFLGHKALSRLTKHGRRHVLASRFESLDELPEEAFEDFEKVLAFDDGVELDRPEDDALGIDPSYLQGLHAKLFVGEAAWGGSVWTGSCNATEAAFEGNVEFMVELVGQRSKLGIDALLKGGSGKETGLGDILRPYERLAPPTVDTLRKKLEEQVESIRLAVAGWRLRAVVEPSGRPDEPYLVQLQFETAPPKLPDGVRLSCWPTRVGRGNAVTVVPGRPIGPFSLTSTSVTSFFAFAVSAGSGSDAVELTFVRNLQLEGAPEDRLESILRDVLRDRRGVLRFLLFLLSGEEAGEWTNTALQLSGLDGDAQGTLFVGEASLFESLLRTLHRDPAQLERIERLLEDLRDSPDMIPEGFERIWHPIRAAWQGRKV